MAEASARWETLSPLTLSVSGWPAWSRAIVRGSTAWAAWPGVLPCQSLGFLR